MELTDKNNTGKAYTGRCEFCNQRLAIINTHSGSALPVEIGEGVIPFSEDDLFDSSRMKSHLLNCSRMQAAWEKKKQRFIKKKNPFFILGDIKERCR